MSQWFGHGPAEVQRRPRTALEKQHRERVTGIELFHRERTVRLAADTQHARDRAVAAGIVSERVAEVGMGVVDYTRALAGDDPAKQQIAALAISAYMAEAQQIMRGTR